MYYGVKPVDVLGKKYDPDARCKDTAYVEDMDSLTVQSEKDDADINVMMERFKITGHLPEINLPPSFGDFTEVTDFRTAFDRVRDAQIAFDQLDVKVRNKFENDPARFMEWFDRPERTKDEFRELGLLNAEPKAPEPMKVEVVNAPATPKA